MAVLSCNGVTLPSPISLSISDEIIWSSQTGRTAAGNMVGDVIAEKKNISINWGILTSSEYALIKSNLAAGFLPFTFLAADIGFTITAYRGTLSCEVLGELGDGTFYLKSASVSIVQQ